MTTSSTLIFAFSASTVEELIYNGSTNNVDVTLGAAATLTNYTVILVPGAYYEVPAYFRGNVYGISTASSIVNATQITP